MKRRQFLQASAAGAAGVLGAAAWTGRANALPFGEIPRDQVSSMLPESLRAQSVLECFLLGGCTPWESFYCVPGRGQADGTWAHTDYAGLIKAVEGCGFADVGAEPFSFVGNDSAGQEIFLGPHLQRLLTRPDVLQRTRIVVNRHGLVTHEAAIPLLATGRHGASPSAAGLATHVNRYFVERDRDAAHLAPFSYAFTAPSGFTVNDSGASLAAQGLHPGHARPVTFKLDAAARFLALLNRSTVGTSAERLQYDALSRIYFEQLRQRLQLTGSGELARADRFAELERAFAQQAQPEIVQSLLPPSVFQPWLTPQQCQEVRRSAEGELEFVPNGLQVTPTSAGNLTAMGLRLATQLLTHPEHPARHCSVVDAGVRPADGGGGYDTHSNGPWRQATNFDNLLTHLLASINRPGEGDANKLELDKTLIILSSEFGRSPGPQVAGSSGRSHWPHGFVQIYIGGPIRQPQSGVYGHIDEHGQATVFTTPAENRIAALLALGIYPFAADAFSSGDAQGDGREGPAARGIIRRVLGHDV